MRTLLDHRPAIGTGQPSSGSISSPPGGAPCPSSSPRAGVGLLLGHGCGPARRSMPAPLAAISTHAVASRAVATGHAGHVQRWLSKVARPTEATPRRRSPGPEKPTAPPTQSAGTRSKASRTTASRSSTLIRRQQQPMVTEPAIAWTSSGSAWSRPSRAAWPVRLGRASGPPWEAPRSTRGSARVPGGC